MTWSYAADGSNKDTVRFLIGDTDSSDEQFSDEEIENVLLAFTNPYRAAVVCCKALAARYSRLVTTSIDNISVNYSSKTQQYLNLASQLSAQASSIVSSSLLPFVGGVSEADAQADRENTDLIQPAFIKDQFDNQGASNELC